MKNKPCSTYALWTKPSKKESDFIYGFLSNRSPQSRHSSHQALIETRQSTKSSSSIIHRNHLQHKTHFDQTPISAIPPFFTLPLIETHQSTKSSSSIIRRNYLQHKTHFGQIRVRLFFFLFLIPLPKINKNPGWCRIKLPGSSLSALQRQEE
ncbi:hypothetical protein CDAR_373331 [Caerostris darwini]|uniref:Uncharacterized protein n=1 Tax=Caerostris darwini TaxID=1538125 RepID=A0AAV4N1N4_9ARAC|nr:hypothetical protein CDAR_373331 [Caerostris darwini]